MTTYSPEQSRKHQADLAKAKEANADLFAARFKAIMATTDGRGVIMQFMVDMGLDTSPFNQNNSVQSREIGLRDAAQWWMSNIRQHTPQMELRMRNEAREDSNNIRRLIEQEAKSDD